MRKVVIEQVKRILDHLRALCNDTVVKYMHAETLYT